MSDRALEAKTCDQVAERVALGEPLAELAEHVETCPRCTLAVALPSQLGRSHVAIDPGLGFAARMTAGAQHRIVVRKRRRIASGAAAAVAACAACAIAVTQLAGSPADVAVTPAKTSPDKNLPAMSDPWKKSDLPQPVQVDPDVRTLVHLADIDRDLRGTAHWGRIEKPLRPYRSLVQGVKP